MKRMRMRELGRALLGLVCVIRCASAAGSGEQIQDFAETTQGGLELGGGSSTGAGTTGGEASSGVSAADELSGHEDSASPKLDTEESGAGDVEDNSELEADVDAGDENPDETEDAGDGPDAGEGADDGAGDEVADDSESADDSGADSEDSGTSGDGSGSSSESASEDSGDGSGAEDSTGTGEGEGSEESTEGDTEVCGDGIVNTPYELCDGDDLGEFSCESEGFDTGVMACTPRCWIDPSDCRNHPQPDTGVYADCLAKACMTPSFCVEILDEAGAKIDGYCSKLCEDAPDCPGSPGGSARPSCLAGSSGDQKFCALDCDEGRTCPAGMTCTPLVGGTMNCI